MLHHRWLTLLIIAFAATIVFIFFYLRLQPVWDPEAAQEEAAQKYEQVIDTPTISFINPKEGAVDPKLTIVEFGDFLCEPCLEQAVNLRVLTNTVPEVQVVWRDMPNETSHELAGLAAVAAHCAGNQGKFWEYHDELFDNQVVMSEELLSTIAQNLELDNDKFDKCLTDRETAPLVQKDLEEALNLGITALPTFFIGSERYTGLMTSSELIQLAEEKIAAVK